MRVLLVNHSSAENELGGAERSLLALGEEWARQHPGVLIDVVTASGQGAFAQSVRERGWELFAVPFWPWAIPHLYRPGENRWANARRDEQAALAIAEHIRSTAPDVVVTNSVVVPWGAVAAGITGTPHVWIAREFGDLDHGLQFVLGTEASWQDVGTLSDLVVANSEAVRDHALTFLPGREIMVTYPAVDIDALRKRAGTGRGRGRAARTAEGSRPLRLVLVGTFGPAKRPHLAVEAVAALRDRGIDTELTLVGPLDHPEYHDATMATARRLGVADRIRVEGYQENPLSYVESADVGLMLSRSEAFGRVTLEYLALGTPVVGVGAGGTTELIADGSSGFVTTDEVESIADAIARYATDPELLAAHREAAPRDAASIAARHPLGPVIDAIDEVARTAPRTPKLPHLTEFWLGLGDDVEQMRTNWIEERNPTLEKTLRQFEESRRAAAAAAAASATTATAAGTALENGTAQPVTIVVPVYGDLPSLEKCILSVIEHGELDRNRLLLVNDCGPDADQIEARILELVDGIEGVEYARNDRNLGFGATCNRAVTELDRSGRDVLLLNSDAQLTSGAVREMAEVLHLAEKHGIACPRSNFATIASFPFNPRAGRGPDEIEHSLRRFAALSGELPRYTVSPVALGFCFLVRRSLIDNFGLFDEIYSPGYDEENDFCLRVNGHGYSSVFANHAFVIHEGARSFTESDVDTVQLKQRNDQVLLQRYPHFRGAIEQFQAHDVDPVDWFSDFLDPHDAHKRVLIDLFDLTLRYDGTSRNALSFLSLLSERHRRGELGDTEFVISSSVEATAFFGLDGFGFRTVWNHDLKELFDLGLALVPVTTREQIVRLDRHCARWVVTHLDLIGTRVLVIRQGDPARKQVILDALRFADRTVVISAATLHDTQAYYPELPAGAQERMTVIPQGAPKPVLTATGRAALTPRQEQVVSTGGYVLAVGNSFPHKQLAETVAALRGGGRTVVVFGGEIDDAGDNIVPIRGGALSDADVTQLYAAAAVVLFPSAYEGFGLPMAEAAAHGRPVVAFDTEVAHETAGVLGIEASTRYFDDFADLAQVIEEAVDAAPAGLPERLRSLDDYNGGLLDVVFEELDRPVDLDRLRARVTHFRAVTAYTDTIAEYLASAAHFIEQTSNRRSHRMIDALTRRVKQAAAVRARVTGAFVRRRRRG